MDEHRLVRIRGVEDPIRARRQSQRRAVGGIIQFVPELDRPRLLGHIARAGTPHMESPTAAERGRIGQRSLAIDRLVKGEVGKLLWIVGLNRYHTRAKIINDHGRQLGRYPGHGRRDLNVTLTMDGAGQ